MVFQDNLKEAEEKRWTAAEKYLTALGFTTSPRLYPKDVWTNSSLPIIVSYLFDGDAELGVGLARNIAHYLPNHTLVLYNLGLGRYDLQLVSIFSCYWCQRFLKLKKLAAISCTKNKNSRLNVICFQILSYCNTSRCTVTDFYLSDFPSHVSDHKVHAYRPIIIQVILTGFVRKKKLLII